VRNILDDKPTVDLHGRNAYTMRFVGDADLQEKDVLEIGCGFGWFALNALPRGVGRLTGVEPTDEDLSTARKYVVAPNVQFELGSALRLPFPDATFDTVVCWEVMEHLPKQSEPTMFAEVGRVLRDNGAFYLSTPYGSVRSTVFDPLHLPIGHRHYRVGDVEALARGAAMVVSKVEVRGGWWEIAASWNLHVSKWVLRRGPVFARTFQERTDSEFDRSTGFACLFVKFRRLARAESLSADGSSAIAPASASSG
jgi:SAM-dependent methyltransferase